MRHILNFIFLFNFLIIARANGSWAQVPTPRLKPPTKGSESPIHTEEKVGFVPKVYQTYSTKENDSIPVYASASASKPSGQTVAISPGVKVNAIEENGTRIKINWTDGQLTFTRWIEKKHLKKLTAKVSIEDTSARVSFCHDCHAKITNNNIKDIEEHKNNILEQINQAQTAKLKCERESIRQAFERYSVLYKNNCENKVKVKKSISHTIAQNTNLVTLLNRTIKSALSAPYMAKRIADKNNCTNFSQFEQDLVKDILQCQIDQSLLDELKTELAKALEFAELAIIASDPELSFSRGILCPDQKVRVTSWLKWRTDPETGERKYHRGLDIASNKNACTIIPTEGAIIEKFVTGCPNTFRMSEKEKKLLPKRCQSGYGNHIVFRNPKRDTITIYAHLDKCSDEISGKYVIEDVTTHLPWDNPDIAVGAKFNQGTIVGCIGNSGKSEAPHLHIEEYSTKDYNTRNDEDARLPIMSTDIIVIDRDQRIQLPPPKNK